MNEFVKSIPFVKGGCEIWRLDHEDSHDNGSHHGYSQGAIGVFAMESVGIGSAG